jgi:Fe-S-cluster containining protein
MPGALAPEDLEPIRLALGEPSAESLARNRLLVSEGAEVALPDGRRLRLRTLVPATDDRGACRFLDRGRCALHAVAPFGCSHFDAHMTKAESDRRSHALCVALARDAHTHGPYTRLTRLLADEGRQATPLHARRDAANRAARG